MKVEFENDEAWNLMSHVVAKLLEETPLEDSDRARIRRWKSDEMRVLTEKINDDLKKMMERKTKSQLRKPDWV